MNLKKTGKVFTSKFVGTAPSPYKKRIYRAAVSQRLRNTALEAPAKLWVLSVDVLVALQASEFGGGCKIFVDVLEPWLRKELSLIRITLFSVHL